MFKPTRMLENFYESPTALLCLAVTSLLLASEATFADGTDMLGEPSVELAEGSKFVAAGVGLKFGQPEVIDVEIPLDATVKQVLIYWDGFNKSYDAQIPGIGVSTDTINVSGEEVTGVFIGGRSRLPLIQHFTYRADITDYELVKPGSNSLIIDGVDFAGNDDDVVTGAGALVVIEQGDLAMLMLVDGSDYAYLNCEDDFNCQETMQQIFEFAATDSARDAELKMFFAGAESSGRPDAVRVWVGNAPPIEIKNQLNSSDGEEWDTLELEFEVPAGVAHVAVQAFSEDPNTADEEFPESFTWVMAALSLPKEESGGGQGCTPGYWKQDHHFDDWTDPYDPTDAFSDHFEDAFPGMNLVQVLDNGGGGLDALGRHTVASLLNAANPDVSFDLTPQEVIDAFNSVYPDSPGDYEALKNEFEDLNEQGCPLNNSGGNGNGQDKNDDSNNDDNSGENSSSSDRAGSSPESQTSTSTRSGGGSVGAWEMVATMLLCLAGLARARRRVPQRAD